MKSKDPDEAKLTPGAHPFFTREPHFVMSAYAFFCNSSNSESLCIHA